MNEKEFDAILENRINAIRDTLSRKAKEYSHGDRLYNFKRAAEILVTTPEKALAGMLAKHLVSVLDLIEGKLSATTDLVDEKIGDTINYLIILESMMKESISKKCSGVD
jgi:hypothetical protein